MVDLNERHRSLLAEMYRSGWYLELTAFGPQLIQPGPCVIASIPSDEIAYLIENNLVVPVGDSPIYIANVRIVNQILSETPAGT